MEIVIVGGGKLGQEICYDLNQDGHEVTLIDTDSELVNKLVEELDVQGIVGSGTDIEVLKQANTSVCDVFIAVTDSDEINLISAHIASMLGASYRIVRARKLEYTKNEEFIAEHFKIDYVINQDSEAATKILHVIDYPTASYVEPLHNDKVRMICFRVMPDSEIVGLSVQEVRSVIRNVVICTIENRNKEEVIIPRGQTLIEADTYMNVIASDEDYHRLALLAGHEHNARFNSIFIQGGSRICEYLLPELNKRKIRTKIIEIKNNRALQLAASFPNSEVVLGDGSEPSFLLEHRLPGYDVAIGLTDSDEENLIFSLYSHSVGVKKNITKVNRTSLIKLLHADNLDAIISPRASISDAIIRRVRSLSHQNEYHLQEYARLSTSKDSEVLEFIVSKDDKVCNRKIMDLPLDERVLIGLIIRNENKIIPKGSDYLLEDDYVIVIDVKKRVRMLDEILK
jgi:trk system potassium uptake protein TrkA